MKFGTLYELEPGPEPWPERREYDVYHEAAEQVVLTEELGFDYAWVVEHHFLTGYSSSSAPEVFLGWLAAQTSRIRLGHGVLQFSKGVNHLVRIAERTAALDLICDGRLDVGSGRGFTNEEVVAFGVDPDDTRPMQEHGMRNLPKLWCEDEFELNDEFYSMPPRRLHPKPIQTPHPPMWMAATQPSSWELAGQLGAGVLAFGLGTPDELDAAIRSYRTAAAQAQTPYGLVNNTVAFAPTFYCAETDEEALETAAPSLLFWLECNYGFVKGWSKSDSRDYEFYKRVGTDIISLPELTDEEKRGLSPQAQVIRQGVKSNLFCVGSPETCRNVVQYYADRDVDQLILMAQLGDMTNKQIQDSLRLFGAEVMPEFTTSAAGVMV
ncbi:LLM class flavin-dependent oxidoreductase [Nocardioides immobilis]|uniref:LLM class flavin-dependent oxidoreductase n=1 Tax=Nocardioides immobilis TaxID=2049295 RepID=UPI0015FC88AB|nr:LLM class flavin-dependent oxidoreductase [Nocardioides immobilis]